MFTVLLAAARQYVADNAVAGLLKVMPYLLFLLVVAPQVSKDGPWAKFLVLATVVVTAIVVAELAGKVPSITLPAIDPRSVTPAAK